MKRVLFVQSNGESQEPFVAAKELLDSDWILLSATTAEKALELHREDPVDVVVAENQLPGKNGIALFSILREVYPDTIRFLIIEEAEVNLLQTLVSDAQQVMLKPLDSTAFIKNLNNALLLREAINNPAIFKLMGKANSLPPLPRIFREVSDKLQDPDSSLADVGELIAEDIVLSSKILSLANSALFSLREPARNVTQAVMLLGSGAVKSLIFSLGIQEAFKGGEEFATFAEDLNQHSIQCASLVSKILFSWGAERDLVDKAMFCAIAHDIGKLVLSKYAPEQWSEVLNQVGTSELRDIDLERRIIGVSHCEVAAYLLAVWGFSNDEVIALAFHHEPSDIAEDEPGVLCALHLAENLSDTPLHGSGEFDWDYLESYGISEEDVVALQALC